MTSSRAEWARTPRFFTLGVDGNDQVDLGEGRDVIRFTGSGMLYFDYAGVGDGSAVAQDGALAISIGSPRSPDQMQPRFDDEGIIFIAEAGSYPGLVGEQQDFGQHVDLIEFGTRAADRIDHSDKAGTIAIISGQGDDTIIGNTTLSILYGKDGNDSLVSRGGDTLMYGGSGDDRFVIEQLAADGLAATRIRDFAQVSDKIDVSAYDIRFEDLVIITAAQAAQGSTSVWFAEEAGTMRLHVSSETVFAANDFVF